MFRLSRIIMLFTAIISVKAVFAQDFDNAPTVNVDNKWEKLHFTIGARFMSDYSFYHSEFTPLKSGASITDARIRTSMTYTDWYLYADFDFSGGKFAQRSLFVQYTIPVKTEGTHTLKAGYFGDPASMNRNTSRGSSHFIARPAPVNVLTYGSELGLAYKYYDKHFFANQGVFAENPYNDQIAGSQGAAFAGRWIWRPINSDTQTLQFGVDAHYGIISTGALYNDASNIILTDHTMQTPLSTLVDTRKFLQCSIPWAKSVLCAGVEWLYRKERFFFRGELLMKRVWKKRSDIEVYNADITSGKYSPGMGLDEWISLHPLHPNNFYGAYAEAGVIIKGNSYSYNRGEALLGGLSGKTLEMVARYSFTDLNDIREGESFDAATGSYHPTGKPIDTRFVSSSIGGGRMHNASIGLNFSFNKYVMLLFDYTYSHLDNNRYPNDHNFHALTGRLQFSF